MTNKSQFLSVFNINRRFFAIAFTSLVASTVVASCSSPQNNSGSNTAPAPSATTAASILSGSVETVGDPQSWSIPH